MLNGEKRNVISILNVHDGGGGGGGGGRIRIISILETTYYLNRSRDSSVV
jgi:hypothetical protein